MNQMRDKRPYIISMQGASFPTPQERIRVEQAKDVSPLHVQSHRPLWMDPFPLTGDRRSDGQCWQARLTEGGRELSRAPDEASLSGRGRRPEYDQAQTAIPAYTQ
jgi:hypothetical protein